MTVRSHSKHIYSKCLNLSQEGFLHTFSSSLFTTDPTFDAISTETTYIALHTPIYAHTHTHVSIYTFSHIRKANEFNSNGNTAYMFHGETFLLYTA